jgi:drug/metabolite transporter (DMT)-like permease
VTGAAQTTSAPDPRLSRRAGIAILLLIAVSFAANHIAARLAFDHGVNVPTAVTVRSVGTVLFVLALMRASGIGFALPRATLGRALLVGLMISVQSYCLYSAVSRIPVALALLAFNTFPFLLGLISWLGGGERPKRSTWIAMVVLLVGLALALDVAGRLGSQGAGLGDDLGRRWAQIGAGVGFALGGAATFACALFLTTRWLSAIDGRLRTLLMMSVVAVVTMVAGSATVGLAWPADATGWVGLALLTLLYGGAITTVFVVLPRIGMVNNAAVLNFEPIAALALGWLILDQAVAPMQLLGAALVIGAIVAISVMR